MPSLVLACCAKISRISAVRSSTRMLVPNTFSNSRWWRGDSSSSKMTTCARLSSASALSSSTFPGPMYVCTWGCPSFWVSSPTTSNPAVSASKANSINESSSVSSPGCWYNSTPTRNARSLGCMVGSGILLAI